MCVQFMIESDIKALQRHYHASTPSDFSWKPHVFPRYTTPVIVPHGDEFHIQPMHFGLIPFFERDEKPKSVFHNARSETVREKPSFKKSYREHRCVVPLESFFEYLKENGRVVGLAQFFPADKKILNVAAIWNPWKSPHGEIIDSVALITTEPTQAIRDAGHERCPLFIHLDQVPLWCAGNDKQANEILVQVVEQDFKIKIRPKKTAATPPQS